MVGDFAASLINQLERKLDLPRSAGDPADLAESRTGEDVGWQAHVDDVEQVEELSTKLQVHQLGSVPAAAKGGVFDERKVKVVKGWPAESIAAQRAKPTLIRSRSSTDVNGDGKEIRRVVCSVTKIVFTRFARGGELRCGDLVRAVDAVGSIARLLYAGVDGEWVPLADAGDAQHLPSPSQLSADRM